MTEPFRVPAVEWRLSDVCFVSAVLAAVVGMTAGIIMGLSGNFLLAPAHAHLNLLGWVTMALMGLYYRHCPAAHLALARVQVGLGVFGFWVFPVALGVHLQLDWDASIPPAIAGAFAALASMVLFAVIILSEVWSRRERTVYLAESG